MNSLIRSVAITVLITTFSDMVAAQDNFLVFGDLKPFRDYPRQMQPGDVGHRLVASCFTGKWYCALIGLGRIGRNSLPFSRLPISNEQLAAIVVIDVDTAKARCLTVKDAARIRTTIAMRVVTRDRILIVLNNTAAEGGDSVVADVLLDREIITTGKMSRIGLEEQVVVSLPTETTSPVKRVDNELPFPGATVPLLTEAQSLVNGASRFIEPESRNANQYIRRSRQDRLLHYQILGTGRIAVSERELSGRLLWLLSEGAFENESDSRGAIVRCYFPTVQFPPFRRIQMIVDQMDGSTRHLRLVEISDGRLKIIRTLDPAGEVICFAVSEKARFAGIELDTGGEKPRSLLCLDLTTGSFTEMSDHTKDEGYLALIGVTEQGALIQEGGGSVYISVPNKDPRLLHSFVTDQGDKAS